VDASGATYYTMNDTQRKIYDVNLFSVPAQKVRGGAPLAANWKWPRSVRVVGIGSSHG
jgi:hypothetical protein